MVKDKATLEILAAEDLQTLIREGRTIVRFYTEQCGPCRLFGPTFEDAARLHPEMKFGNVNVEKVPGVATSYLIEALPTTIVYEDGVVIQRRTGYMPSPRFEQFLRGENV